VSYYWDDLPAKFKAVWGACYDIYKQLFINIIAKSIGLYLQLIEQSLVFQQSDLDQLWKYDDLAQFQYSALFKI